jgi:hypothetical protein
MKRKLVLILIGLFSMTLLSGCVLGSNFGGGKKDSSSTTNTSNSSATSNNPHSSAEQQIVEPTIGQQLLDLKKARDAGAVNEQEYETEKAKILDTRP